MKALVRSYGEAMAALEHDGARVRWLGLGGAGMGLVAPLGHGTVRWRMRLAWEERHDVEQGTVAVWACGRWHEGRRLGLAVKWRLGKA